MATARRETGPFYPPRARWYSPLLNELEGMGRAMRIDRVNVAFGPSVNLLELVAGFLVPGLAIYFRAPGIIGKAALAWSAFLIVAFLALLGNPWGNLVFGLLLSVHVSGFVLYCTPLLGVSVRDRLLFTLAMVLAIRVLVYYPAQTGAEAFVVTPIQWQDNVVVVRHVYATNAIRPGDWLAYTIAGDGYTSGGAYFEGGIDFAQVLARPGDRIAFSADSYSVNGTSHPRRAHMPQTGSFVVPQKEWFVWPNLAIHGHGTIAETAISNQFLQVALVTEKQLIGTPFRSWFWRKQTFS